MDLSNRVSENGSSPRTETASVQQPRHLNMFDLVKVGLSSTFAIIVFIGIGYVVKHVAGPSTILSILLAAFIAYLVGTFYTELNKTIVLSAIKESARLSGAVATVHGETIMGQIVDSTGNSKVAIELLLPSHEVIYVCNGEFVAFVIAWNLIMEYIIIVALVSKALIIFIDALFFDSVGHLTQIIPMSWYLSSHFDVLALFVPIIIGVTLLLLLGRDTIFNVVSIALSLLIVVIFLFFGIFNADITNWDRQPEAVSGDSNLETGGFYAYGVDGVFKGAVIILFMFIAFDTMVLGRWSDSICFSTQYSGNTQPVTIENFTKTINQAILSINTVIFLCLLGMAFALTTIQPIYSMDKSLPLLSVIDTVFSGSNGLNVATKFIILIAGCIALVGSLYAMLHAEQRVIQTMLSTDSDDSTFKLFGKFGLSHLQQEIRQQFPKQTQHNSNRRRRWQTGACLLFSILSGLLAGLFAIEHLINLLSIGTLLMLFALTIDIMILRYSGRLNQRLHHPCENGTSTTVTKSTRSISLVTILLSAYCLLAATLAILIKIVISKAITISMTLCWIFISILIASLLVIVFILNIQPKGNAIFSLNLSHPLLPASVLFGCIFLFTAIDVAAWIRLAIWMTIGMFVYFISPKKKKSQQPSTNGVTNGAFTSEIEMNQNNFSDDMTTSIETIKLEDNFSVHSQDATILNHSPSEISPKETNMETYETKSVEFQLVEVTKSTIEENEVSKSIEVKLLSKASPPQIDHSKLNEISCVDDIKHICVERREPNGTAYFVEVDLIQNSIKNSEDNDEVSMQNGDNINENTEELEKNIVERVLSQSDVELRPRLQPQPQPQSKQIILTMPSEFEDSESEEEEKEVRAIVHAPNEHSTPFELSDSTLTESSISLEHSTSFECLTPNETGTSPGVIRPMGVSEKHTYSRQSPNFQIGIYEALPKQKLLYENDKERLAFKMRLEDLFGQSDEKTTLNRAKSNFSSPIAPHSKRLSTLNHSISAPESLLDEAILNDTIKAVPSKIPIPPAFNQDLYDTVARRNRKAFSTVSHVIDVSDNINDHVPTESVNKKGNLSRTQAHENLAELDVEYEAATNIKQKLEEIFSKGRATQLGEPVDLEANQHSNNENIRRSKRLEPFDTVRKQKILFSDVLKSIGPDIHSNLHPTHTTAAIDIQETQRRESLD